MTAFLSTFTNKVDLKGRVSVPASFRSVLERQSPRNSHFIGGAGIQVALSTSYKHDCLEGFGDQRVEEIVNAVDALPAFSDEAESLQNILSDMHQLSIDSDGRIVMPPALRDHAGIGEMATFVGTGKSFQIWTPEGFKVHRKEVRARAREQGLTLRIHQNQPGDDR